MSIFTAFSSIVGSAVTSHINRWLLHFSLHSIKFRIEPINKGLAIRYGLYYRLSLDVIGRYSLTFAKIAFTQDYRILAGI